MKQFRPIGDALRYVLSNTFRNPNLAAPKDALTPRRVPLGIELLKDSLSVRQKRCTQVLRDGPRLRALASARARAGIGVWEVERLHLPVKGVWPGETPPAAALGSNGEAGLCGFRYGEEEVVELLEGLTQHAGSKGAERVILRVRCGSPVEQAARRTGFFPYYKESLLQCGGRSQEHRPVKPCADSIRMRPRFSHEEYAVFQLYSASTPSSVRSGLGMTFRQWKDAKDDGGLKEEVYEREGKIRAWLGSSLSFRPALTEIMVHPDEERNLPALLDYALGKKGVQAWLVPDYQELLRKLLTHRGFTEEAHYSVLIKTIAVRVRHPSLAAVEARVW